jgi:hypothetical protein
MIETGMMLFFGAVSASIFLAHAFEGFWSHP